MTKNLTDFFLSLLIIILIAPFLFIVLFLVYLQDFNSPFYVAKRVGRGGKLFKMYKIRSMIVGADLTGVDSTSSDDQRITKIGHFIRKFKVDELSQLINVILGNMSLVGPRPNVLRETNLYTTEEKLILTIKPGITDFSSIVFSDEGEILEGSDDPDLDYNQLIRPWKSRLALIYVNQKSFFLDLYILFLTGISFINKEFSRKKISKYLESINCEKEIINVVLREGPLIKGIPPGASEIVTTRNI